MMPAMRFAIALLAIGLAGPAAAGEAEWIIGRAVALDGDTIRVFPEGGGEHIDVRLWGIDAPEMSDASGHGWVARAALDSILDFVDHQVGCRLIDTDRYGRPVAVCGNPGKDDDIGMTMIFEGWAVEYRKFTRPPPPIRVPLIMPGRVELYQDQEQLARKTRRGRWKLIYGE